MVIDSYFGGAYECSKRQTMRANYTAATDREFLGRLESWFHGQSEVLMMIRFSHSAGAREFEFFSSFLSLSDRIRRLPPLASVIVFRKQQLPLRGIVDDDFISRCLSVIPDGSEYLVVETVRRVYGKASWFHDNSGTTHGQLLDDLKDCIGAPVAVGLYPPWLEDTEDVISAFVPDEQGIVRSGVY